MYLRDLAVYASDAAVVPAGYTLREVNDSAHTPVEAYLDRLPRRKVILGNLAKVNIVVGPRRPGDQPYFAALNVAILSWPRFDFARYAALPRAGQQRRIIQVVHKSLLQIANRTGSDTAWYEEALTALNKLVLPLPEITEAELARRFGLLPRKKKRRKRT